nr:PREDICTED: uncharacterized protein LOC106703599 isoform X1 [Latimeria chalumnae]|eukprot:XP_014344290.1 PREDICTED: uncharacterized protein LOC106703599 isoform X1 [Latimeria chalumnae]
MSPASYKTTVVKAVPSPSERGNPGGRSGHCPRTAKERSAERHPKLQRGTKTLYLASFCHEAVSSLSPGSLPLSSGEACSCSDALNNYTDRLRGFPELSGRSEYRSSGLYSQVRHSQSGYPKNLFPSDFRACQQELGMDPVRGKFYWKVHMDGWVIEL